MKVQDLFVVFHANPINSLESVCLIISSDVTVIQFSYANINALVEALQETMYAQIQDVDSFDLNVVCILRGYSSYGDPTRKLNFHESDMFDEQTLILHEFLQVSKCIFENHVCDFISCLWLFCKNRLCNLKNERKV